MKNQRDYYQDWLTRLRKELAISGRKSELLLYLEQQMQLPYSSSQELINSILRNDSKPDLEIVLEIDQWRANKKASLAAFCQEELNLEV